MYVLLVYVFLCKQKTAYEMRISDWSSDVCSSDLGTLANSALRTDSGALGVSWVGDRGFVGVGYSLFNSRYGVPGHEHAHDEGDDHDHDEDAHAEEGGVHIVMDQRRRELSGGQDDLGPLASLRGTLAHTDYTHPQSTRPQVAMVVEK